MLASLKTLFVSGILGFLAWGCAHPPFGSGRASDSASYLAREFDRSVCEFDGFCFSVDAGDAYDIRDKLLPLEERVVAAVYDMRFFDTTFMGVCVDDSRTILNATAVITNVNFIKPSFVQQVFMGQGERVALGADVFFIDAATSDTVGMYTVHTQCSGSNPKGAVSRMADEIIATIRENCHSR